MSRIIADQHQIEFAEKVWQVLRKRGYAYLAGKPRSGKTYTAVLTMEKSVRITNVLVLTTKAAIKGWHLFTEDNPELKHTYHVTNYEQLGRIVGTGKNRKVRFKLNPADYDAVIIDESHNLGTVGKPSQRYLVIKAFCANLPHLHLSGTAIVESGNSIYYQMNISKYSPFKQKSFYDFHREWGIPYTISISGREINQYDRFKPELLRKIDEFTIYMTQEDAGISKDLQAKDKLHYVELSEKTKEIYNTLQKEEIFDLTDRYGKLHTLICDSTMKLRTSLHMLESGVASIPYFEGEKKKSLYVYLGNTEKIDYILNTFGDTESVGIMSHFIPERKLLKEKFKHAQIFSSKADAEGVDLSHLKYFVILSQDYSGAKAIQRRERIINTKGSNTLDVHYILTKKAISEQVYKTTSKKIDFNNSTYERTEL